MFSQVPGLEVVLPANVSDAAQLLLASIQSDLPTIFVEAKPLYRLRGEVELPIQPLPLGKANIIRRGKDITFIAISYMVGFAESVAVQMELHGISAEIIDLRTLSPLDEMAIVESITRTGRVAVFDVGWQRFSLASEVARVICMNAPCQLRGSLVSVGQEWEHTSGGCFREHTHYPIQSEVIGELLELF